MARLCLWRPKRRGNWPVSGTIERSPGCRGDARRSRLALDQVVRRDPEVALVDLGVGERWLGSGHGDRLSAGLLIQGG